VLGVPSDLKRLLRFLLRNAVRLAGTSGKEVAVGTANGDGVTLSVEASGPPMTVQEVLRLFEVSHAADAVDTFELAACRSIARRLHANLEAEPGEAGGFRVNLTFSAA
jgi:signal transduction histidine kinase